MRRLARSLVLCGAALAPAAAAVAADPAPAADLGAVLEKRAPAVVCLKYVFKSQGREWPYEARGTVVDPTGLVLLSNAYLSWGDAQAHDLKALFGNDAKEWEAVVVARDSALDLAFVQVLGLGDKPVAAVDASQGGTVRLGQDLVSVWRDTRGFDYAPAISRHYVAARVEKPRPLWAIGGDSTSVGLFLFDEAGLPVGVATYQNGSDDEASSKRRTFLLPLPEVVKSLNAARKRVGDAVKKADEAKKEPPSGEKGELPVPAPEGREKPAAPPEAPKPPQPR